MLAELLFFYVLANIVFFLWWADLKNGEIRIEGERMSLSKCKTLAVSHRMVAESLKNKAEYYLEKSKKEKDLQLRYAMANHAFGLRAQARAMMKYASEMEERMEV